jgi:mannose-1-phosphate guanylyltransferase
MSRQRRPKQFLALGGAKSLLRQTWDRVRALAPPSRIWVVAPKALASAVRGELADLRKANLIVEPSPRDTGPAVALACAVVARRAPDAIVAVFPTDHVIGDARAFARSVGAAATAAARGMLVCLGVKPDRPATGYGYLKLTKRPRGIEPVPVSRFVEKPSAARARRFLTSGRYLWNGGMFVWSAKSFLDEALRVAPELHAAAVATAAGGLRAWERAPRLSVDYAVMEKARSVTVVPLDAGWDDVGSWDAAARLAVGRRSKPPKDLRIDSPGSAVFGERRVVALLGVKNIVVVDTDDVLLVASRSDAERVKALVEAVRRVGRGDLL